MIVKTRSEMIITLSYEESKLMYDILIEEGDLEDPKISHDHSKFADRLSDIMAEEDDSLRS